MQGMTYVSVVFTVMTLKKSFSCNVSIIDAAAIFAMPKNKNVISYLEKEET